MKTYFQILCMAAWLVGTTGCAPSQTAAVTEPATPEATIIPTPILFDDFTYTTLDAMQANGWGVRSGGGLPGVTGASFRAENVSFVNDPDLAGNRLLRMTSSTDGTGQNTFQTQLCHQRKYWEGTYAARVHFSDVPASGPDGDQIVETFYMISPYVKPFDPDYSELDFEYLANGGWGGPPLSLYVTTWETVQIEPWNADNTSNSLEGSQTGWHILVVQALDGLVRYFIDEQLIAQHGGKYYPDAPMSINFNLWFIEGGLKDAGENREYREEIDWVFHAVGVALMPDEVSAKVTELREASVHFQDTVLPGETILESPCDL